MHSWGDAQASRAWELLGPWDGEVEVHPAGCTCNECVWSELTPEEKAAARKDRR